MKSIYELKLFEIIQIESFNDNSYFIRVPGGWVYKSYCNGKTSCFVPFDNEFKGRDE